MVVDRDGAGRIFHPLAYLDRVTAVANAPTYCWVDSAMNHGIVGGSLKSHTLQTEAMARLAVRVLRGERADSIPTSSPSLNVTEVDWRQLRRWQISEARVPPGTIVRFREPSAWERYRIYILGAFAVLLAQTALIAGLLVQRARRRQVEADLRGREADLLRSHGRIHQLGQRLLTAQDTERSRIARELHDDISQQMALLEIDLQLLSGAVDSRGEQLAHEALQRAQSLARSVHDLSHRLHPAMLRLIGLVAALDGLVRELSRPDLALTFQHAGVPRTLPPDLTLCLFRVVQEAVQNAIKYSGARRLAVDLHGTADLLALSITDDGAGFDVPAGMGKGLGLISMVERVEAAGGTLDIRSAPGAGTTLSVSVPVPVVHGAVVTT
jgi:signal transduction histidine kinase